MIKIPNFENPGKEYRVDVRWWLAEGHHTDRTLKNEIRCIDETGFGAAEFLAMKELGVDSRLYGWGSEEWVHDSRMIFEETTKRGLGVSATCGTHWACCNLTSITPDDRSAAKELDFTEEILAPGETRSGNIPKCGLTMPDVTKQDLVAVTAVRVAGTKKTDSSLANQQVVYLDPESAIVLTDQVKDGLLTWQAPGDGTYKLFFFWIHGTGQTASPASSTAYTVNYLDRDGVEAFMDYWDHAVITDGMQDVIDRNPRPMMYMDSLELSTSSRGGQLWGYHFLEEFQKRRGYDLTPYLPFIVKMPDRMEEQNDYTYYYESPDPLFCRKLRNDLYQIMTELYMDNMLKPMQAWCHRHHMQLRAEISYGLPFEISLPGKYVDGIETESLEFCSQIECYRNMAGPAHIYNRIYSSETGATRMNYMCGLDYYIQIMYTQFAAGVTRTVLHGYSSIVGSEEATHWPGHEGMYPIYSERFGVRQPAFRHYRDFTLAMSRYQMILRSGKPRMDIGILRLDYHFNNMLYIGDERTRCEKQLMRAHTGIYWKDMTLQDGGFTWDYFAPQILNEDFVQQRDGILLPDGPGYQALIIYQEMLPIESARKILDLAVGGLPVLFVDGVTETIRPGIDVTHEKAACMTPFLKDNFRECDLAGCPEAGGDTKRRETVEAGLQVTDGDMELQEIVRKIKRLPNVAEINDPSEAVDALHQLGVRARTEFIRPNGKVLPLTREEDNRIWLYLYNMAYTETNGTTVTVSLEKAGVPYFVDCWTGKIEHACGYEWKDGRTVLNVSLQPGEARIYALDLKADKADRFEDSNQKAGAETEAGPEIAQNIIRAAIIPEKEEPVEKWEFTDWDLEVEDWNEGERREITEDRGKGLVTKEVYYETNKNRIRTHIKELKPWKDIPEIGSDVSGVGYYSTEFNATAGQLQSRKLILKMDSIGGNTAAVYVNGQKADPVNPNHLSVDITAWVRPGANSLLVEVTSTLNNRLKERGYFDHSVEISQKISSLSVNRKNMGDADTDREAVHSSGNSTYVIARVEVQDYGLMGHVWLYFTEVS